MNNQTNKGKGMKSQFDKLTSRLTPSATCRGTVKKFGVALAGLALAGLLARPAAAQVALGRTIEISFPNPLAGCDNGLIPGGTWTLLDAAEPHVAVNPLNRNNIVAAWMGAKVQEIFTAASFDGGMTWQQSALPLTLCVGGPYYGGGDVTLSFAPNGDLLAGALTGNSFSAKLFATCKSTDGGLHWSAPVIVSSYKNPDKPTITADPTDSRFVYATWHQDAPSKAQFARSTDGGLTWEPRQSITTTSDADLAQVLVLPDGTLVELYVNDNKRTMEGARSTDRGQSWSDLGQLMPMAPLPTVSPEQGKLVRSGIPSYAVDGRNGNLYVVWEDGRFSNFQYNDIAFSMSADGGFTWSAPIRINQTPLNIAPANRQAFIPVVAVAADGTIAVSYYDFRYNDPNAGLLTDCWVVQCHPSATTPATNPGNWGGEVRLTARSFDLEAAVDWFGLFIGDYEGLAATGNGFIAAFGAVDENGITSIFARRVSR